MDSVVREVESVQTAHALADELLTMAMKKAVEIQQKERQIYEAELKRKVGVWSPSPHTHARTQTHR